MTTQILARGLGFVEGPVWHRDALWFTVIDDATVSRLDGSSPVVEYRTGGGPNGMTASADGALYVTNNGGAVHGTEGQAGIQRLADGRVEMLATSAGDTPIRAANDLCFGPDGLLYFTDPANPPAPPFEQPGQVMRLDPGGDGQAEVLHTGLQYPNGIAFHPDGSRLLVAETFGSRVVSFPWTRAGLGEPEDHCRLVDGFPDGMCFDADGNLYVAATMAHDVQVYDNDGKLLERLSWADQAEPGAPSLPTNCCFGGPDMTTLFVTESAVLGRPTPDDRKHQCIVAIDVGRKGQPLLG